MSMASVSNTICVMDASGCLGKTLVHTLLRRGYTVHAAVQNRGSMESLNSINDGKNLKIFQSEPFDYRSLIQALNGCCGLFYTFEPTVEHEQYDESMLEVEVRAAHNVLEACVQTQTVEKVVFTSSVTAAIWKENKKSIPEFDERDWSEPNFCRKYKLWYALTKTLAEKTAWALAMDRGINMVSVNAGLLMGPGLTISNPYLKGASEMYEDGVFVGVEVDYLADAHVCVFENPSTYGRYLCFNHVINRPEDAIKLAQIITPETSNSSSCQDIEIHQQRISNKKLNKLMVNFDSISHRMP